MMMNEGYGGGSLGGGGSGVVPPGGDYVDLHELAKGWKAAIARAKDPATRYVLTIVPNCAVGGSRRVS